MKVALIYDFDKTLSTHDMQEFGYFDDLGLKSSDNFWAEVEELCQKEHMDHILTYLYHMVESSKAKGIAITRERLASYGPKIEFFEGVLDWFELINNEGLKRGIEIEHYIISSGLTEIIENTAIAKYFRKVFACEFLYDAKGEAIWPKLSVNYTMKTQFVFRINKNILEIENDNDLNQHLEEHLKYMPFTNMIYIGDGFTDVPSMKLIRSNGGYAIAVYHKGQNQKDVSEQLLEHQRVNFIAPADYRKDQRLHGLINAILDQLSSQKHLRDLQK